MILEYETSFTFTFGINVYFELSDCNFSLTTCIYNIYKKILFSHLRNSSLPTYHFY